MINELEYKNRLNTWNGFTKLLTYSTIVVVVVLSLMAITLL